MVRVHAEEAINKPPRYLHWWKRLSPRGAYVALMGLLAVLHTLWLYVSIENPVAYAPMDRPRPTIADALWQVAAAPMSEAQGIVLPLFDDIATLGVSLILELRAMEINLPIEVPHCGDLNGTVITTLTSNAAFDNVRVYDVCVRAAEAVEVVEAVEAVEAVETDLVYRTRPLFCENLRHCHDRFRSFDIKVIALLFSQFEEIMMLDADVMFLQNPMSLWRTDKFQTTGTLFFTDRIDLTGQFLSERVTKDSPNRSMLHEFVETFDRSRFQQLANVPRHKKAKWSEGGDLRQDAVPSPFLALSHAWQLRADHQADSSVMLWSKARQPRATAILGSFVTLQYAHRPTSYGDKELYFLACEVADSDYAFSDFSVGAIGADARPTEGVLCGDALHFFPVAGSSPRVQPLYVNSDHLVTWQAENGSFYRTDARPASLYPGSFDEMGLPKECPFGVTMQKLTVQEIERFRRRQRFHQDVERLFTRIAG